MKFEKTEVMGVPHALRGMRNPLNSWERSDSSYIYTCNDGEYYTAFVYQIGKNDLDLAQRLIDGGSEHRKFMRQIFVSVDITAPLYWWKEFDTYKIGTTSNSCSTMHKLASKKIQREDFSIDNFDVLTVSDRGGVTLNDLFDNVIADCEYLRKKYLETKDKRYWKALVQLLPTSYNQKRTITMTYENLRNMYFQRKNHKLSEWSEDFIRWVESLPYAKELITYKRQGA